MIVNATHQEVVLNFDVEVEETVAFDHTLSQETAVSLTFTEAKDFNDKKGANSLGDSRGEPGDGPPLVDLITDNDGHYVLPDKNLRGGFRNFTLFSDSPTDDTRLEVSRATLEISFQSSWPNLKAYRGYFHSDDELFNKI